MPLFEIHSIVHYSNRIINIYPKVNRYTHIYACNVELFKPDNDIF